MGESNPEKYNRTWFRELKTFREIAESRLEMKDFLAYCGCFGPWARKDKTGSRRVVKDHQKYNMQKSRINVRETISRAVGELINQ